ncbi:hypothetical protein H4R99_000297 [Coemansia sp. RSA 1722]|nr:hypothetical protein IWW45_004914 [Coemansia sp. RSA 485]KAJ2606465.1 hypothetical protein H4R99_000297 [Coemansia sp. RSA 1722]KAJ2638812.1 hypothetical protein GGF40_001353 [Coemansia sp. RSA 1286]
MKNKDLATTAAAAAAAAEGARQTATAEMKPKPSSSRRSRQGKSTGDSATKKSEPGTSSRGGRSARGRAKPQQPVTSVVVPRILARPQETSSRDKPKEQQSPVVVQKPPPSKHDSDKPPQITPRKPISTVAAALDNSLVSKYLTQQDRRPGNTRLSLLTASGKLLDTVLRRHLGSVQYRSCIGVLGRAGTGKSTVMSFLADTTGPVFPVSKAHTVSANGMDLWITPSQILLLDSPSVLSLSAAEKWTRRSDTMSKLACARLRDLQITSFLLQVCDTLVVVVRTAPAVDIVGRRGQQAKRRITGRCVDQGIIGLLKRAALATPMIPGLSTTTRGHQSRTCSLHIVVNGPTDISEQQISQKYAESTGIPVSQVTVLPAITNKSNDRTHSFTDIYDRWSACNPTLPLFSTDMFAKPAHGMGKSCLVASSADFIGCTASFEECVERLKSSLLDSNEQRNKGWRKDESKGAWMAACLKTWDSIRRSDVLAKAATAKDKAWDEMYN